MPAPKGTRPPNAGKGRQFGTKNKITKEVKEMVIGALQAVGGQKYLETQAVANPVAFMSLIGKVLPMQVTGEDGGPIVIVTGVDRAQD